VPGVYYSPVSGAGGVEFDPLGTGTTSITGSIPGFIQTTVATQTVTVTGAGMTVSFLGSVAGGLQDGSYQVTLGASAHGGVTVRIRSSDATRVLVSPNSTTAGAEFIDVPLANGFTQAAFWLQGVDWVEGTSSPATVTITATATGFNPGSNTVNYLRPALRVSGLPVTTTSLSANNDFYVEVGYPNAGNTQLAQIQSRRAGAVDLVATLTNSEATVAEIDQNGGVNGAQTQTVSIVPGVYYSPVSGAGGVEFDPLGTGTTSITGSIPGFIQTTAATQTVTVTGAGITVSFLGSIGGGLQDGPYNVTLGASAHGGVTVRIRSSDATRVLVSPNATTAGAEFIDVPLANGFTQASFWLKGLDWIPGTSTSATVTITGSAAGFTNGTNTVNYVQPALRVSGLPSTPNVQAANNDFYVEIGYPNAGNTQLAQVQQRRVDATPSPLTVTVTNSNGGVAELDQNGGVNGAQTQTASIVPGLY
jgi:hypothetical protein